MTNTAQYRLGIGDGVATIWRRDGGNNNGGANNNLDNPNANPSSSIYDGVRAAARGRQDENGGDIGGGTWYDGSSSTTEAILQQHQRQYISDSNSGGANLALTAPVGRRQESSDSDGEQQ